jgi:hypothetical protein
MLDKVLNRIKNSKRITSFSTMSTNGHRIDDRLTIETWNGHCTGIFIDGIEVKVYVKSHPDESKAREIIRTAIREREKQIQQELVESLDLF